MNMSTAEKKLKVKVPDWAIMWKFVQNLELFKCNLIDLVHNVDTRHVHPTAFNDIYEIISCGIITKIDISIVYPIFSTDCLHRVKVQICVGDCGREIDSTLIFPPEREIWWLLV